MGRGEEGEGGKGRGWEEGWGWKKREKRATVAVDLTRLYWQFIKLNVTRERESTWNVNKTRNRFDLNYAITFLTRALSFSFSLSFSVQPTEKLKSIIISVVENTARAFHASVWSVFQTARLDFFIFLSHRVILCIIRRFKKFDSRCNYQIHVTLYLRILPIILVFYTHEHSIRCETVLLFNILININGTKNYSMDDCRY